MIIVGMGYIWGFNGIDGIVSCGVSVGCSFICEIYCWVGFVKFNEYCFWCWFVDCVGVNLLVLCDLFDLVVMGGICRVLLDFIGYSLEIVIDWFCWYIVFLLIWIMVSLLWWGWIE